MGAVGIPVNEGDAIGAFNNRSFVLVVTLESNPEIALILDVILAVLEATAAGKVLIVDEEIPPTVFTVGDSFVPPKSPPKLIAFGLLPPVPETPSMDVTKEVVAIWSEFVPLGAVGAVGVPVKAGDANGAFNKISAVLTLILAVFSKTTCLKMATLAIKVSKSLNETNCLSFRNWDNFVGAFWTLLYFTLSA